MGIIDTLRKRLIGTTDKRNITGPIWAYGSDFGYSGIAGADHDLMRTDDGTALAHSANIAAYRAVDARMRAVGSMPWRIVDMATDAILCQSDDSRPAHRFAIALMRARRELGHPVFSLWELSMSVTGKAFIEPVENEMGFFTTIDWLNPTRVTIDYYRGTINGFRYNGDLQQVYYQPHELIYERFPNLVSDVEGLSPLAVAMQRVNINVKTDRFLASFFRNNSRFGQVIAPTDDMGFDPMAVDQLKQQVNAAKGSDNGFRTLIASQPIEVFTQDAPDLSKHVDMIERVETSIYTALGVPRPVAGDVDGQRYQASPETLEWFYQNTVIPRCRDIEQIVNNDLLPKYDISRRSRFEFDTSEWERLSPTRQAQMELTRQAYQDGAITLNDYRAFLNQYIGGINLEELKHGNVFLVPGAGIMINAEQLGALQGKPSYITFQSPQTTIQQAGEMAQSAGINVPNPPPPETNPASEAPAAIVEEAKDEAQEPPKASQDDALSELRTWRKFTRKHGAVKAARFEPIHLDADMAGRVQYALKDDDADDTFKALEHVLTDTLPDVLPDHSAVFADCLRSVMGDVDIDAQVKAHYARLTVAKSIQSTRIDYEDRVDDLFVSAVNGDISRVRFGNALRSLNQTTIPRAYSDGLEDGGLDRNALDETDLDWISNWISEQRSFVIAVSDAIYKDDRVTAEEAQGKGIMWWNKSIAPAYYEGLASASTNAAFEWVLGNAEHCYSCLKLNGQRRRLKFWRRTVMPKDQFLECKGFNCRCELKLTNRPLSRGRLPVWQRAHSHD